uniref:Uncharacterized protein n=1 Tax=Timema genevievae TaxID=629358 RepID=A0A7R9PRD6_TIMGE|nr:unnamed protein product [Timema genevievae]
MTTNITSQQTKQPAIITSTPAIDKLPPARQHIKTCRLYTSVRQWRESGMDNPMCTARPGWQTMSLSKPKYKNRMYNIRVNLIDILKVDTNKMVNIP